MKIHESVSYRVGETIDELVDDGELDQESALKKALRLLLDPHRSGHGRTLRRAQHNHYGCTCDRDWHRQTRTEVEVVWTAQNKLEKAVKRVQAVNALARAKTQSRRENVRPRTCLLGHLCEIILFDQNIREVYRAPGGGWTGWLSGGRRRRRRCRHGLGAPAVLAANSGAVAHAARAHTGLPASCCCCCCWGVRAVAGPANESHVGQTQLAHVCLSAG
eukprot:COSAG01_NODE_2393_length_7773_cov_3.535444_2_plen_218_part_00